MNSFVCPQCHNTISETDFHKLDCSYADLSKRQIDVEEGLKIGRRFGCGYGITIKEKYE